jgi:hypothetical protein
VATEVKDSLELVHTANYANFLKFYLPVFKQLLKEVPPQTSNTPEHKLRNQLLEILNRLPHNELLRPLCTELLELTMEALLIENEENSTIWYAWSLLTERWCIWGPYYCQGRAGTAPQLVFWLYGAGRGGRLGSGDESSVPMALTQETAPPSCALCPSHH